MSNTYEVCTNISQEHEIKSSNVLLCAETGRVIAVFYNDYDLEDVKNKLKAMEE